MSDIGKAEQWCAQLESIIRRYRAGLVAKTDSTLTLEQALAEMHKLHLSDGEALRYLQSKAKP